MSVKHWMLKCLLGIAAFALVVGAVFVGLIFASLRATQGRPISHPAVPRTALLVVDIQEDYTGAHPGSRSMMPRGCVPT